MDYEIYIDDDLLKRLTPDQAKLAQLMSDISEECWCAGWCTGTEYRLWQAMVDPEDHRHWGQDIISDEAIEHLRKLSTAVMGWIVYGDDGEQWMPLAQWMSLYEAAPGPHRRANP